MDSDIDLERLRLPAAPETVLTRKSSKVLGYASKLFSFLKKSPRMLEKAGGGEDGGRERWYNTTLTAVVGHVTPIFKEKRK
jgi:hypothetical protein